MTPFPHDLRALRLLVFDLDGTLIDSKEDLARSVNAMRERLGLTPLDYELVASYVGQGMQTLVRRALGGDAAPEEVERALPIFIEHYGEHLLDHTVAYPGVREALEAMRHLPMAVLTNKPVRFSRAILAGLELERYFAFIYGGDSFERKKPDPIGLLRLMHDLDAGPRETLMVGDSDTDILTGRNAGVWTCGVTYGIGSKTLANSPPDLLVNDLRELAARLRARPAS
jgi:phosphoglycolate phosphatase